MNKKILSIFVMVMALSLLGVSCNKKTTDPTENSKSAVDVNLETAANGTESSDLASEYSGSNFPNVDVVFTGTDGTSAVNTSSGSAILVSVDSVEAVTKSGYKTLSGIDTGDVTIATAGSGTVTLAIDGSNITGTSDEDNLIQTDANATTEQGIIAVSLRFKDETGKKSDKVIKVYITVKNTVA